MLRVFKGSTLLLALLAWGAPAVAEEPQDSVGVTWETVLQTVVPAVVSIRVTAVRSFDTENAGSSQGTGFLVDRERGIILTNRHMVHAGPVLAEAVFLDDTEVELQPIYRDPVHDFGFYRVDPARIPEGTVALPLVPEAARAQREIRVVGNDAGEKVSILDGTLARLDRNAPYYGDNTYNDFNTFYFQAASNTSGGSSGSPVVDQEGRVIALNAGGATQAASSFYLPLDRVTRALSMIQRGQQVTRGTMEAIFTYTSFDELYRLGLPEGVRAEVTGSDPDGTGMLVVSDVVPGGPADGLLHAGDVLYTVEGLPVTRFVPLEEQLDARVGEALRLEVFRGGALVTLEVKVEDLHRVTPAAYLDVSRGVVHELSLQQARNHAIPAGGPYVALSGYMLGNAGIPEGAVFTSVDGQPVGSTEAFRDRLASYPHGKRVRVRYFLVSEPRREVETTIVIDREWFPMQTCTLDATGLWPCVAAPAPPAPAEEEAASFHPLRAEDKVAARVADSLVMVNFDIPVPSAGMRDFHFVGVGVVVDAERGLVVVDRDTVPVAAGDIEVTFGGTVRVPAELVYLHPVHNLAVIRYDPARLLGGAVRGVPLRVLPLAPGERVWQVGLDASLQVVSAETTVEERDALYTAPAGTPRFRDANVEGVDLDGPVSSLGGLLADRQGRLIALWASFVDQASGDRTFHGLPASYLERILDPIRAGEPVAYRDLGAELFPLNVVEARDRGLSEERVRQVVEQEPYRRRVLEVVRIGGGTPAEEVLREGDILLEMDGIAIPSVGDLERASSRDQVALTLLRDGMELTVELRTVPLEGGGVDRMVSWAGLQLHEPHREVAAQRGIKAEGVYISWMWYGSPAARYNIRPVRRLVAVNDVSTPDMDTFLAAIAPLADGASVRLKLVDMDEREQVRTLKVDLSYWPTQVYELRDGRWSRTHLERPSP
ncbi:MAG: trypsin-like peptidase domain-containing protein [Deltaproteobacteria bacterium]|nr:trypsin-like peptidase domain-containing protein [Deltaproteobacteria bacterium]